jgi:3-oxoacyl-[acyl-carrier protein] reductase
MRFKDSVVVVTGAGQGIGEQLVRAFAAEGASCALLDVNEETVKSVAGSLEGDKAAAYAADVTDMERMEGVAKEIVSEFGKVDVLVNNAGVTRDGLMLRMTEADWDLVLDVNLKGAFVCTKVFGRHMLKARGGRIVNVSSVIGLMGNAGQANYSASKAGLIGLTKSSAKEFASRGVTVNAVAPGYIQTAMTEALPEESRSAMLELVPQKRMGTVSDVAGTVLFLAGPDSAYVTGEVIRVDGGMCM